jgi:hypothetical protein
VPSTTQRTAFRPWIVAGLIAAAGIAPAGCAVPSGHGLIPSKSVENQSRALPANQSRALPANQSRALPASRTTVTDTGALAGEE